MWILLISLLSQAKNLEGEELWSAEPPPQIRVEEITSKEKSEPLENKKVTSKKSKGSQTLSGPSNLPSQYTKSLLRESNKSELIQPPKSATELFKGLKIGDLLMAQVRHSIIAFPDEKAPVVAEFQSGPLMGLKLIGESHLEPNSKRIFIEFNKLIQGHQIYSIKGVGVSAEGQPGLVGEYHSREAEYFTGDFIASFAAGYFDGLIPRRTNVFGQVETEPSVDTAVKKGLASGAMSTAERFKEKLKKVHEFSEIQGPLFLKILILEQAITN